MAIKHYNVTLTTIGPVHVGSGKTLGKTDYFTADSKINVIDTPAFFKSLNSTQKELYEKFLENPSDLNEFIRKNNLFSIAKECVKYKVLDSHRLKKYHEVSQFIRDQHGNPYIPGSSLKGILRTILANYIILSNQEEFKGFSDTKKGSSKKVENSLFKTETYHKQTKYDDDLMRYISVSDSNQLSNHDLLFAKKYDMFSKQDPLLGEKKGNELNIYRESIKPGVNIQFRLDIDEDKAVLKNKDGVIKLTTDNLMLIIQNVYYHYYQMVLTKYDIAVDDKLDIVYVGGGTGFASKTIDIALFGNEHVKKMSAILYNNFSTRISDDYKHASHLRSEVKRAGFEPRIMKSKGKMKKNDPRHWDYKTFNVAPHTLKCAKNSREFIEFGKCKIELIEI